MFNIYWILTISITIYLIVLFLINLIPNVSIKYVGFFSLRGITINTRKSTIYISKISLRFNLFESNKDSGFKLVNLEIVDVQVTIKETAGPGSSALKLKIKNAIENISLSEKLHFKVPNSLYEYLLKTRVANRINIHVFRCAITHQKILQDHSIFLDYTRLNVNVDKDNSTRVTVILFNGLIQDKIDRLNKINLFRNIEFYVNCQTVTSCGTTRSNAVSIYLSDFKTSLSIGRLNVPLDLFVKSQSKKDAGNVEDDLTNTKVIDVAKYKNFIKEFMSVYSTTEIRLEDLTLSHKSMRTNLSNFVLTLEKLEKDNGVTNLKFMWYLTSFKFYHIDTKCFELPSATFFYELCPIQFLTVAQSLLRHEKNPSETINFDFNLTMSNPVFDIYYDQQDIVLDILRDKMMKRRMNTMRKATGVQKKEEFFTKMSIASKMLKAVFSKLVVVDTKLNLHLPEFGKTEIGKFNRLSKSNSIITVALLELILKVFTRNINKGSNKFTLNTLFKMKNVKCEGQGNKFHFTKVNLLATYNMLQQNVSIKLSSKSLELLSANDLIFHIVRLFKNRQRIYFNKKFEEWKKMDVNNVCPWSEQMDNKSGAPAADTPANPEFIKLFEVLPSFISSVKIDISSIVMDMVCKEGLPSHKLYDEKLGKEIDLKDFRRGISFKVFDFSVTYKLARKHFETSVALLKAFTLSEYASEYIEDFDKVTEVQVSESEISDLSSINSAESIPLNDASPSELDESNTKKIKTVLTVRDILVSNAGKLDEKDPDRLTLSIPEVDGRVDMFLVWCCFYAKTMLERFKPTVESSCTKNQIKIIRGPRKKLKLDVHLDSVALVIRLPRKVDVMIEIDRARLKNALVLKSADIVNCRLYVVDPSTKFWARLLIIKEPKFSIDFTKSIHDAYFGISTRSIRISVPNRFLFYTVIDNFITFFKAIKQLLQNFRYFNWGIDEFETIYPSQKNAIVFPHVNIKTAVLGMELRADPFENKLALIFELGKIEQKERIRKWKAFEKKSQEILDGAESNIEDQIKLSNIAAPIPSPAPIASKTTTSTMTPNVAGDSITRPDSPPRSGSSECSFTSGAGLIKNKLLNRKKPTKTSVNGVAPVNEIEPADAKYTIEEAEERIAEAKERLFENFSKSWCRKYRVFEETKCRKWKERGENIWGSHDINEVMKEKYDIVEYDHGKPLTGAIFRDVDLTLDKFKLGDVDKFLYDYAKHQPKLTYSILCPMYVELKARKFYMILKDYPLPVASFPRSNTPSSPTIHIKTNLVIHEKLFSRKEELRYIYVPFSPAVPDDGRADNFYSVNIPRTLTPVKVAADFNCDLNTDRSCTISWCKSYQPAFSAMAMAFENFTKPAIDDSPIGWWDKIPLIVHGRYQFNIANELCLHMKSGRNPHELIGKNAGFVFCWKNNVKLVIDGTINSKDLVVLESDDFIFAIPNYSIEEKNVWSLFYDDFDDPVPDIELESKKFNKYVIKLSSSERVRWVLGMLFERNKYPTQKFSDEELRVSTFKPHYEVMITNPANEFHPDSYEGYRSDYVHMSLSVISRAKTGETANTAYFTPLSFHHFFYWWDTLLHYSPPPIKRGKLFEMDQVKKPKIKFGTHMFTMKYQLIFNPVTISHLYRHSTSDVPKKNSRVAFTGLKGRFDVCEIDLHQRREYVTHENKKLNRKTKIRHLKMNQAEVNIENADARVIYALFNDTSVTGKLMTYLNADSLDSSTDGSQSLDYRGSSYLRWLENVEISDGDFSWYDPKDFIELEVREPLSPYPKTKILPFFATPKFSYYREFTLQKDGPFPFGSEKIHDCIMNLDKPAIVQSRILLDRLQNLEDELAHNEEMLRRFKIQNGPEFQHDIRMTEREISTLKEKVEVVRAAYNGFSDDEFGGLPLSSANNVADDDDGSSSLLRSSTGLSAYSSHVTQDQMLQAAAFVSIAEFHNRFILHNLTLKWDDNISKYFISYMKRIAERKSHIYYMTKYAVDLVEKVMQENAKEGEPTLQPREKVFQKSFKQADNIVDSFEDDLDEVKDSEREEPEYKYLVKLIHPQIQMISRKAPDSCVLISSKDLELRIVDINMKDRVNILSENNEMTARIERRTGVLFREEQLFVLQRDEVVSNAKLKFAKNGYMSDKYNWPPWFECEVCYDGSWAHEYLVSEKNTIAIIQKSPNQLFISSEKLEQGNELVVYLSKYVINATSAQYSSIYYVITGLLLSNDDKESNYNGRLQRLMDLADASDFEGLDVRVHNLQQGIRDYRELLFSFDQKGADLNEEQKKYLHVLELEMERLKLELILIMNALQTRIKATLQLTSKCLQILADQVIWHMLDDDREPFIDFALASTRFIKHEAGDGSTVNILEIGMVQGFNLQEGAKYPQLLGPDINEEKKKLDSCHNEKPIISMSWTVLNAVGGIPIIKNAKLETQRLQLELEYATAKKLESYLFPKEANTEDTDEQDGDEFDDIYVNNQQNSMSDSTSDIEVSSNDSVLSSKNPLKRLMSKRSNRLPKSSSDSATSSPQQSLSLNSGVRSSNSSALSSDEISFGSGIKLNRPQLHLPLQKKREQQHEENDDEMEVIIARSLKFKSLIDIEIANFQMIISFSAPSTLHLLDVHRLVINIPTLRYVNKIWSAKELTDRLKKDVIKVILQHSGKILGNKFKAKKKTKTSEPLKQISNYSKYMTLDDLQQHGRERDSSTVDHEIHRKPRTSHKSGSRMSSIGRVLSRQSVNNNNSTFEKYLDDVDGSDEGAGIEEK